MDSLLFEQPSTGIQSHMKLEETFVLCDSIVRIEPVFQAVRERKRHLENTLTNHNLFHL